MAVPVYGWVRHIWMGRVYEMGFKAMSKPTSLEDADSAIEMQKGDTVQSSNDNIDTLENILDKYYAPIKLPDYNRTNLIQALNLYIEERVGEMA